MPPSQNAAVAAIRSAAAKPAARADLLARTVAAEILDGSRPVGTPMPEEAELAKSSGLTPATARAALRRLEALGLVARGQGGDMLVVAGEVRAIYQIAAEAPGGGNYLGETTVVIERRRRLQADAELAVLLDVAEDSEWAHLIGVRLPADPSFGPLSWVDVWLTGSTIEAPEGMEFTAATLESLLATEIADVHEELSVAPLTPAQARLLRARGGEGSLQVMRRYRRPDGSLAAALRDVHPAGRISVLLHSRR